MASPFCVQLGAFPLSPDAEEASCVRPEWMAGAQRTAWPGSGREAIFNGIELLKLGAAQPC